MTNTQFISMSDDDVRYLPMYDGAIYRGTVCHGRMSAIGVTLWYDDSEPSDMPVMFGMSVDEIVARVDSAFDDMIADMPELVVVSDTLANVDPFGDRVEMYATSADMPLDCVRTCIVEAARGMCQYLCTRDEAECAFDRDMRRAINACKTSSETF